MKARTMFLSAATMLLAAGSAAAQTVQVFKDAGCGCCEGWVAHMERHGFDVAATDVEPYRMEESRPRQALPPIWPHATRPSSMAISSKAMFRPMTSRGCSRNGRTPRD
jgi:hypothetical protein